MSAVGDIRGTTNRRAVISLIRRLSTPQGQSNPLPLWAELRALGDVVPAPWGGHFVTGYDACHEVLHGPRWLVPDLAWQDRQPNAERWQAVSTREMSRGLSRLNAPLHTAYRRGLGSPFNRDGLAAMQPRIARHVADLLADLDAEIAEHGQADFAAVVSEQLPMRTVGAWLGIPDADHARILGFTHRQGYAQELLPTRSDLAISEQATYEIRAYFTDLIRRRRARMGEDALSGWIRYWDQQYPHDRAAADQTLYDLTFFVTVASLETTATLLSTAVWHLSREPARWGWLRNHPEHIDSTVEEALRYDPPIHLNSRVCAEDTTLAGIHIPADSLVHVLYGAAAHDPRRNPDPDSFDITRTTRHHLTFGGGAHYCMGAGLARLEARALLSALLERPRPPRPVGAPAYEPRRMVFRRLTSLMVKT